MNLISASKKDFLRHHLVYGKYRFIGKIIWGSCITTILFCERLLDIFANKDNANLDDLTIIIKTFERDSTVRRLVRSIKKKYPDIAIIVANDSEKPEKIEGVQNLIMPYDSGLSAGRNAALKITKTKYFLLLDDDFVFSRRQNLGELIAQMEQYEEIDILGGGCIEVPFYSLLLRYFHEIPVDSGVAAKIPVGTLIGNNRVVDKVLNYFIARTDSVKKVLWDEKIKIISEHNDFFARAKGVLVTAYKGEDMLVLHAKTPFDKDYLAKRFRTE